MAELLLEAVRIRHSYADRQILSIDALKIYDGERIGLIGENGAGKSTLLRILSGDLIPDEGSVHRRADVSLIRQFGDADDASGRMRSEFAAQDRHAGLSGGELTRRRIAQALSQDSHLLLADEPTTDLDADGVVHLSRALQDYPGAVVLVSHDRKLLDDLCTRILHLEDGSLTDYPGNYASYRAELERRRAHQAAEYQRYRDEQARLRASIQGNRERASQMKKTPTRMGNSEARLHKMDSRQTSGQLHKARRQLQSRLDQMEVKERPREDVSIRMALGANHPVAAKIAIELRGVHLAAGGRTLIKNGNLTLPTGSRTAIVGENGCGKTTLLRTIASRAAVSGQLCGGGMEDASDPGRCVRLNPAVRIGWFDQTHERTLDFDKTVLENAMRESCHPESDVRTVLARMNLRGDDVFKPVGILSGGERGRLALAKLLVSDANVLMLDEPTNHLDLFTLEALEEMLKSYRGTILFVSHDQSFREGLATRCARFWDQRLTLTEGSAAERQDRKADRAKEDRRIAASSLQMRMAALAARMSKPKKGDDPILLNEEYQNLAKQLRELQDDK